VSDGLFLVLHLMVAGRLHWKAGRARIPGRVGLAAFDFPSGTLLLTEAGSKKRASLYVVAGEAALREHDPGGLEVLQADPSAFQTVLARENHTLNGRYGKPCPDCGSPVQRIVSAEDETNYCARGQTGGRLLSGRMLSRLLKSDWPRTLEQLESTRASPS